MTVDLFSLQQMQYISLPGEHKHLEISCEGSTSQEVPPQEVSPLEVPPQEVAPQVVSPQVVPPPEVPITYITSRQKQEPFRRGVGSATLCNVYRYIDCYKIYRNNMIFFVYSNISSYFPNQPATEDPNHSWMMANEFCQLIGADLLYFTQRAQLDDFTTMLLEVRIFPFVEAVFIGLRYNELKVNLFKNKNACQWDAYLPLKWPFRHGGCLPRNEVCPEGRCTPPLCGKTDSHL